MLAFKISLYNLACQGNPMVKEFINLEAKYSIFFLYKCSKRTMRYLYTSKVAFYNTMKMF